MADIIDRANDQASFWLDRTLEQAERDRAAAAMVESLTHCMDCGEIIPEARRKAVPGCVRCARCQEEADG